LLTHQYRFTPLGRGRSLPLHWPSLPDFRLALHFFYLRGKIEGKWEESIDKWKKLEQQHPPKREDSGKMRRRIRRYRR
ncbi:MAG: hypothetical protein VXZ72_04890, partial [Chlamydiota bacterium]|nr:hypothetical protein [Chlamydiota bacterium]